MMVAKILSTAAAALALSAAMAQAQSSRIPAEVPPASYSQAQYVDSNGCVFIRAGSNGMTTWVPRFGDDRRPMCGFEPSVQTGAAQVAAVTVPAAPAPAPVTVTAAVRTAPRAVVTAAASVATGGVPYSVPPEASRPRVRVQAAAPQAQVWQAQAGTLDTRWSFYDQMGPSPCTNYSPHSQMYAVPSPAMPELPLRCGPQAQHPADALRELSPRGGVWEPWNGSPAPAPNNNVYMLPQPYAPRWPQPWLQGAAAPQRAPATAPRASVSTMGTSAAVDARPADPSRGQMTNGQYVQIGSFGVPANAQSAISRLQSRSLPVAQARATAGGQALQIVLAGPFASSAELGAALNAARALGYSDAFVR